MKGTFTADSDRWQQLRHDLLSGRTLPPRQIRSQDRVAWSSRVADDLLARLGADGVAVVDVDAPLSAEDFIDFGRRLGRAAQETDPAVRPYVEHDVILNLVSGLPDDVEVPLQPFSVSWLALHSEGSGRPLADQPRYIVLMCREPGDDGTAAQTVLVPMSAVADRLEPADLVILGATRYQGRPGVPTVSRRTPGGVAFSFRDFQADPLHWECDAEGVTEADVNRALGALLTTIYDPELAGGVDWRPGRLAVIDNARFFHGRAAGRLGPGARRHLQRLRIQAAEPRPMAVVR